MSDSSPSIFRLIWRSFTFKTVTDVPGFFGGYHPYFLFVYYFMFLVIDGIYLGFMAFENDEGLYGFLKFYLSLFVIYVLLMLAILISLAILSFILKLICKTKFGEMWRIALYSTTMTSHFVLGTLIFFSIAAASDMVGFVFVTASLISTRTGNLGLTFIPIFILLLIIDLIKLGRNIKKMK
jgi:hypothetical protein